MGKQGLVRGSNGKGAMNAPMMIQRLIVRSIIIQRSSQTNNHPGHAPGKEDNMESTSFCNWSKEDPEMDGPWETDCGHYFDFSDPDDKPDNVFQYCPYCGGKITCSS